MTSKRRGKEDGLCVLGCLCEDDFEVGQRNGVAFVSSETMKEMGQIRDRGGDE